MPSIRYPSLCLLESYSQHCQNPSHQGHTASPAKRLCVTHLHRRFDSTEACCWVYWILKASCLLTGRGSILQIVTLSECEYSRIFFLKLTKSKDFKVSHRKHYSISTMGWKQLNENFDEGPLSKVCVSIKLTMLSSVLHGDLGDPIHHAS